MKRCTLPAPSDKRKRRDERPGANPVILLTLANDRDDRVRYLCHLAEEARHLRQRIDQVRHPSVVATTEEQ